MKFLSRLLLLGICFELLVAPIKPELAVITVLKANADASTCGPGTGWSEAANRCLVNATTAQTQRDVQECMNLTGTEQQKCFEANAKKAANQNVGNVQDLYSVTDQMRGMNVIKTMAYALPLVLFTYYIVQSKKANKGKRCMAPSFLAMAAGAVASAGGEVYGWIKHSSNVKKLNDKRKEITKEGIATSNKDQQKVEATNLQSEAFQLLADEQKSVAALAKVKKIFYGAATVAYAASAGIAVYELIQLNKAKLAAPTSAAAAAQYATLMQKYQCVVTTTQKSEMNDNFDKGIEADKLKEAETKKETSLFLQDDKINLKSLSPDFEKLKLLAVQSHYIKNASSIEELFHLTEEFESIKRGDNQSNYYEIDKSTTFVTDEEKDFLKIYAAINLESSYDYFLNQPEPQSENQFVTKILSNFSIEDSLAQEKYKLGKNAQYYNVNTGKPADIMVDPKTGMEMAPVELEGVTVTASKPGARAKIEPIKSELTPLGLKEMPPIDIQKALGQMTKISLKNDPTAGSAIGSKTESFLRSPKFRIAFGGVMTGLTTFMTIDMAKQQKLAEDREANLLKLKLDFENTQGMKICTPAERNDQSQPGCYCYTADGARNMARSNSKICQNMWNSVALNNNSYLNFQDTNPKVCITQSNQIDQSCGCRATKTCMSAAGFNISGINLSTLSTLGSGLTPVTTAANGNGATLDTAGNLNSAMRLRAATEKLLKDPSLKNDSNDIEKGSKDLQNAIQTNQGNIPSMGSGHSAPSSLANFDAKAALEQLKDEVESSNQESSPAGSAAGIDVGSSDPTLEFGLTEEEAAVQEQQVAEVLQQDMDLGNNDISTSNSNIFELLTNRYQRSGMRRLFDTEGKTEADKPAETDINK